jgi:hypothetical protein
VGLKESRGFSRAALLAEITPESTAISVIGGTRIVASKIPVTVTLRDSQQEPKGGKNIGGNPNPNEDY